MAKKSTNAEAVMTEAEAIRLACPKIVEWFEEEVGEPEAIAIYTEKCTIDGGRVDALIAAVSLDEDEDEIFETVAIEAKSLRTVRQLVRRYRSETAFVEAGAVGFGAELLAPGIGWAAAALSALIRLDSHRRADASLQALNYPGDFRVLLLPKEVFALYPGLDESLSEEAEEYEFGLARIGRKGRFKWLVEPMRHEYTGFFRTDWLDHYQIGEVIRDELREAAGFEEE